MADLGDTVRLVARNDQADGGLIDPETGPTLTVTLPDGTSDGPIDPVQDSVGIWHADYVTTQAGRHVARWVATGDGAFSSVEVFNVDDADPGYLFGLADAKKALGWDPNKATSRDAQLLEHVAAVTPVIEDIVGPVVPRTVDEWYDGGGSSIMLLQTPVISVTTLAESWGAGNTRTLTLEDLSGAGPFDGFGYTVDLATGLVRRRSSGVAAMFPAGRGNVHAVYVAGLRQVPPNLLLAAKEQLRLLWQLGQQGNRPGFGDTEDADLQTTASGFLTNARVIQLCGGAQRIPGIA